MRIGTFLQQARVMFLPCTMLPVAVGGATAYLDTGRFDWPLFLLSLLGASAAHLGVNLANDYFDYKQGADKPGVVTEYSGGGGAIVRDRVDPERVRRWSWACFATALVVGVLILLIVEKGHVLICTFAVLGFLGGYYYTAPPLKLAYRGLGELDIFIILGPAPAMGAYAVQTGTLAWSVLLFSLPVAGLIAALLWINQYSDFETDKQAGKRNLVVVLGRGPARWGFLSLVVFVFSMVVIPVATGVIGLPYLIALLPLPLAAYSVATALTAFEDPAGIARAQGSFLWVHLHVGLLCAGGIVASALV